jgi:hypothetical protein
MTDRSASPASVDASALEIMLRDLRECGANRGEPCGVHERPQWTCAFCLHNLLAPFERVAAAPRAPLEPREDEIGLSVDMLDVDRLRKWAENVETYGPDLTLWAYPQFVSEWLRGLADRLDTTVRDIGVLRATRPRPALPQEPRQCPSCGGEARYQERIAGLWLCNKCGHEWDDPSAARPALGPQE